jgi:DNA invertase Pin-like site-specific DNA recombinase
MATKRTASSTPVVANAVAYVRVSSDEQADADRYSLSQQRRAIEAYCTNRGWMIVAWYADEAVSAKTENIKKRPDLHKMITDLQDGRVEAQVIVTHTLDRIARNLLLAINTLRDMSRLGIIYSSVTESDFDYSNPDKRMHLQILAMFAEYFSEKLSQHTSKASVGGMSVACSMVTSPVAIATRMPVLTRAAQACSTAACR